MELFQLTNQEGKIFFKIRNLFGEEVAQGLDKEQLAEQYPKVLFLIQGYKYRGLQPRS